MDCPEQEASGRLFFNEGTLNHVVACLSATSFFKAQIIQHASQLIEHGWATAKHETIVFGIKILQTNV